MRKARGRRPAIKSEKEEIEKKIMASLRSPRKIKVKSKTAGKVTRAESAKKRPSGKRKTGITVKGKTLRPKTGQKQTQKSTSPKKVLKPLKLAKAGTEKKAGKKTEVRAAGKTAAGKAAKMVQPESVTKPEKKLPSGKAKTAGIPKRVKKSVQKPEVKQASKSAEIIEVKRVKKPTKVRAVRKTKTGQVTRDEEAIKEIKPGEFIKRPGKEKAERITRVKVEERAESRPLVAAEFPPMPWETLPAEYGENGITLMVVDPRKLFSFWEIGEDTLKIFKGQLVIRLYDVTGIDFERVEANSFVDIALTERIGKEYIHVDPEKEYIADVGIIYDGIFMTIARSQKVSTPGGLVSAEVLPSSQIPRAGY